MAKDIILCVDCEGNHDQLTRIWNIFQKQNVNANFFFVGETVLENKELVKEISLSQHIDSHTFSHANLRQLSKDKQRDEILKGKDTVEQIIGKKTYGFRAPFHAINQDTVDILNNEKFIYDLSVLYYRYNMRDVVEIYPCWFREWTELYEWLNFSPHFAWHIIRGLFYMFDPLVIPVHPHYSGKDDSFAAAMEEFIIFAKKRDARFLKIPDYLKEKGKWSENSNV